LTTLIRRVLILLVSVCVVANLVALVMAHMAIKQGGGADVKVTLLILVESDQALPALEKKISALGYKPEKTTHKGTRQVFKGYIAAIDLSKGQAASILTYLKQKGIAGRIIPSPQPDKERILVGEVYPDQARASRMAEQTRRKAQVSAAAMKYFEDKPATLVGFKIMGLTPDQSAQIQAQLKGSAQQFKEIPETPAKP